MKGVQIMFDALKNKKDPLIDLALSFLQAGIATLLLVRLFKGK